MIRTLVFAARAHSQLQRIFAYLERQRPSAVPAFAADLDRALVLLQLEPAMGVRVRWRGPGEARSWLLRSFPYRVYYRIDGADLIVLAVLHTKRGPGAQP